MSRHHERAAAMNKQLPWISRRHERAAAMNEPDQLAATTINEPDQLAAAAINEPDQLATTNSQGYHRATIE